MLGLVKYKKVIIFSPKDLIEREKERERERERETERETVRDRERERGKDRETERQRETIKDACRSIHIWMHVTFYKQDLELTDTLN